MGLPIQFTKLLTTASAAVIAGSQAHGSSGAVSLSGTVVTLDSQRRVSILLSASNSGAVIITSGTNETGGPISESITVGATATTLVTGMDFKTITGITATTLTGNISVGTNTTGSSPWQMANPWCDPVQILCSVTLATSGAATYSAELTLDLDPCGVKNNTPLTAVNAITAGLLSGLTTSGAALLGPGTSGLAVPMTAWRLTITTGTGSCVVQAIEAGVG